MSEDMKKPKPIGPTPKPRRETVSMRLPPDVIAAVKAHAKASGVSVGEWVEWAIKTARGVGA